MLTQEQVEYYDALEELFTSSGWRILSKDAEAQIYQNQADALDCRSWDAVNVLRGKNLQLLELVNLEAVTTMQKQLLEEEEDDADL